MSFCATPGRIHFPSLRRFTVWSAWLLGGLAASVPAQTIPSGGTALVAGEVATTGGFYGGDGPVAERTLVDVTGQTFARAARVATLRPASEFYLSAITANSTRAVEDDDVVLLHFFMRAIETTDETGTVTAQAYVEGPGPGYVKSLSETITAGPAWTEYFLPFQMDGAYASGQLGVKFGFGASARPQVLELGGVEVLWYGKTRTLAEMPRTSFQYDGRAPNAPWRTAAAARIEQYRKGTYTVRVVNQAGQAVPGATVRVRQRRHAFEFGTAFVSSRVLDQVNATNAVYREKLLDLFNAGSTENDLKWAPWTGEWGGSFSRQIALNGIAWAQENGLKLRGHVLVWPSTRNLPTALTARINANDPTIPATILSHIDDITTATKPYLNEWDVLNEPYDNHDIMDRYGNQHMIDWFKRARANHPTAELYINDYGILSGGGLNVAKQNAYETTTRYIRDGGGPVTGMGFQGHFSGSGTGIPRIWEILQRYATAFPDLKFRITEFDHTTDDESLQADFLRDLLTIAISHPQMQGVQLWGFWAGAHWRSSAAMYRMNWDEKPNGAAYRDLVYRQWWTDVSGSSSATGTVTGRGFSGSYTAEASLGAATAAQNFELSSNGTTLTLTLAEASDFPTITQQPQSSTVSAGSAVTLSVTATGPGTLSYQWYRDQLPIAGATQSTHAMTVTADQVGFYTVAVANTAGSTTSSTAVVRIPPASTRLVNIATRAYCDTGNRVTIGGFVISGSTPKRVLIRALGPTLTAAGVANALVDPVMDVYRGQTVIASNDNWPDDPNAAQLAPLAASLGAGPIATTDRTSSATLLTLTPGAYTVIIRGRDATPGITLFEVFDADFKETNSYFANIATRAYSTTGDGVAIGGFVITGSASKRVLVRAVGPTLTTLGISQAEALLDPTMRFYAAGKDPVDYDNWTPGANSAEIVSAALQTGALPIAVIDSKSAAQVVTLAPGAYTTVVSGVGNTSGIVLVEVYDAD